MRIFGELWDAPVCEGQTAEPVPVGAQCMDCGEEIRPDDSGFILPYLAAGHSVHWQPQHRECSLLHVVGHAYGYCHCNDYGGLSEREASKRVWELVTNG